MRQRLRRLFSPEGFRGPVLTLLSGTTVVLALSYLALPLLARLYTPAEFGVADLFVALLTVLVSFTSLRYEDAVMLPEEDEDAATVLWLALAVVLGFVALLTGLLVWRETLARWLGAAALAPWLLLVPPTLLAMRSNKLAELWLTRVKRFRVISGAQVAGQVTMLGTRIGAGVPPFNAGAGGLIGGFLLGTVANVVVNAGGAIRGSGEVLLRGLRVAGLKAAARRYKRFPLFSTPSTLIKALLTRLPIFLLAFFFDEAVVGLYGRAFAVLAIPLSLVGAAVAQVFFVHAAEAVREERLAGLTATVHARLVMLGLFPSALLMLAGPDLFEAILGADWRPAGLYLRYLAPWLFLAAVASPLASLFDVLERQRLDLLTSLAMFAVQTAALLVGGWLGEVALTLLLLGASGALVRVFHLIVMLRLADVRGLDALRAYGRYALFSLPALLLVAAALPAASPWLTTGAALVGGVTFALLVLWRDRLLVLDRG